MPMPDETRVLCDTDGLSASVTLVGFRDGVGEYTLPTIEGIVRDSVARCVRAWRWAPNRLVLSTHERQWAMAASIFPVEDAQRASLSVELFERYDAEAIRSALLHEIAHFYREEKWPRDLSLGDYHDAKFCAELQRVDPSPRGCTLFDRSVGLLPGR